MKLKEKHLQYFEVVSAFNFNECPVCFLVKDRTEKFFDNLLYENINDLEFRKKFKENFGFCDYHSYKFLSYNDGVAVALCYEDLLSDIVTKLKRKDKNLLPTDKVCIVCNLIKKLELKYISVLIEYINDVEFKEKFVHSDGLCVKHLQLYLKKVKKVPEWFLSFHLERYSQILGSLEKYIDNCNFTKGKNIELSEEEKLIWKKVVRVLSGVVI